MSLLIKGGFLVDPGEPEVKKADLLVDNGKIVETGVITDAGNAEVIDANGMYVFPGFIDLHTHLREPGQEGKETILTGTSAAVAGGFTAVTSMPNTIPACDNPVIIDYIIKKAKEAGLAKVYPVGCITKERKGEEIAEFGEMAAAGAVAFSDDGNGVQNSGVMRNALLYGKMTGKPFLLHCEDKALAGEGVMHEGEYSTRFGLKGIPALAEEVMMLRDIQIAAALDTPIHICHLSTAGAAKILKWAKEEGINVTAEVTPHHFTLTDADVEGYDTNTKVNPPLRSKDDVEMLKKYLAAGIIDAIATDHAPHSLEGKNLDYNAAPPGLIGLETAASLVWTELVLPGLISPNQMARLMSENPARILHVPGGRLEKGGPADITIFDPGAQWTVDASSFFSRSKNSPFCGRRLTGRVICTIVDGKVRYRDGEIIFPAK